MDTKSLISNYVWLIDFIRRRGRVTYRDINNAWQRSERDGGLELSKRTFLRHINDIADIFGIDIECEGCGEYCYFITNDDTHLVAKLNVVAQLCLRKSAVEKTHFARKYTIWTKVLDNHDRSDS